MSRESLSPPDADSWLGKVSLNPHEEQKENVGAAPKFKNPDKMVTFIIGKASNTVSLLVHKEAACEGSPVFKAAFEGNFIEGQTQIYRLEETSVEAFKYLMQWLYSKTIHFELHDGPVEKRESCIFGWNVCLEQHQALAELWVLADMLLIPEVQNITIAQIQRSFRRCCMTTRPLVYVYANTAEESPLRRLLVQQVVWSSRSRDFHGNRSSQYPKEFLLDMATLLSSSISNIEKHRHRNAITTSDYFVPGRRLTALS